MLFQFQSAFTLYPYSPSHVSAGSAALACSPNPTGLPVIMASCQ